MLNKLNKKTQNFIKEYLDLCLKYNLCIASDPYDDFYITTISDYDYYNELDDNNKPIPIYPDLFIRSILDHAE